MGKRAPQVTANHLGVIRLAGEGHMVAATARRLHVSTATVRYRRRAAMRALGARNMTHAYTLAHRRGLLS